MTNKIPVVTATTFEKEVLKGEGPIAVEFMSYSCEHCRKMEPILDEVADLVKSKEKIFKVNVVTDKKLADRYGIQGTPTFAMFLNGKEVGHVEGPTPTVPIVLETVAQPFGPMT
jgi:thioredoxin 1